MGPVDCDPASIHQPVPSILLIGHPLKYHRCQRMPYPGSLVPPRQVSDVGPTGTPVICSFGNCDGRPCPLKHHGEPLVAFLSSASILDSGLTKATQGPPRLFFPTPSWYFIELLLLQGRACTLPCQIGNTTSILGGGKRLPASVQSCRSGGSFSCLL